VLRLALRRLAALVPVLLGVSTGVFLMLHLVPGDPARLVAGQEASAQDVHDVRQSLGLDAPLLEQYARFLGRVVKADFGVSFRTKRPVAKEIGARYGNTILLGVAALTFAVLIGTLLGTVSAMRPNGWIDHVSLLLSMVGISMPTFFLGLLLMLLFSVEFQWFPLAGADSLRHLVLPAITLGLPSAAVIARMVRTSLMEVLQSDYVRTARAKGATELQIMRRHAFRNAMVPVVTVTGLQMGYLLGGAVIVETVFAWPGLGQLVVQAISARDFPVVQAAVLILAVTFVFVNLLTDLAYGLLDPRIGSS